MCRPSGNFIAEEGVERTGSGGPSDTYDAEEEHGAKGRCNKKSTKHWNSKEALDAIHNLRAVKEANTRVDDPSGNRIAMNNEMIEYTNEVTAPMSL